MQAREIRLAVLAGWIVAAAGAAGQSPSAAAEATAKGWQVPESAVRDKSPLPPTAATLKKGKDLFGDNCQKCHGPGGKGDGPYGDPQHRPADLTQSTDAEGIMFY